MFAVLKREYKAYMSNVYGWLFMAVLLLFFGFMMFLENLVSGAPYIEYAILSCEYVLILMIPVLCMRSMAEDRRNKTDMFYLSLPLKTSAVVLGKYFALLAVYAIPCGVIAVYPVILNMFGDVNLLGGYSCLLYFFLLGASLIAVCQFLSSLTDNLVVAAVLGILGTLVLYVLPVLGYLLDGIPVLSDLLVFLSPFTHFQNAGNYGLFSIPSVILLLSYPVLFVFLTVRSADRKRWA